MRRTWYETWQKFQDEPLLYFAYGSFVLCTDDSEHWDHLREAFTENSLPVHIILHKTANECSAITVKDRRNLASHCNDTAYLSMRDLDARSFLGPTFFTASMMHF